MRQNPINRVRWAGDSSIPEVQEILERTGYVEIQLPPDFHHALFRRLHPGDTPAGMEMIDVADGVDILAKVATVRGLAEIQSLESLVLRLHARVHLISPVPLIILSVDNPAGA